MSELNVTAFAFLFHSSSKPSLIAEFSLRERVRKQEVFWKKQTCFYSSPTTLWKDGELPFPTELLGTTSVPACSGPSPPPRGLHAAQGGRFLSPHSPHAPHSSLPKHFISSPAKGTLSTARNASRRLPSSLRTGTGARTSNKTPSTTPQGSPSLPIPHGQALTGPTPLSVSPSPQDPSQVRMRAAPSSHPPLPPQTRGAAHARSPRRCPPRRAQALTMYQVPRMMVPVRTWQQPQQRVL